MAVALKMALTIFFLLSLKKTSLVTCNSVCFNLYPEDAKDAKETLFLHLHGSLNQIMGCILNPIFALTILLILATDIEICPGPRANFAGYFKNIRRTQGARYVKFLVNFIISKRMLSGILVIKCPVNRGRFKGCLYEPG